MMAKAALVVLAGCVAIVTAQIPQLPQLPQLPLQNGLAGLQQQAQSLQNIPQQLQGFAQPLANGPLQAVELAQNALGQLTGKLGDALVTTYDNTRDNVYGSLDTIGDLGQKGVESGVKLAKNGIGLLFLLPQFGRNLLSNQPHTRSNQYPAQYNPQLQGTPQAQGIPQIQQYQY